MFLQRFRYRLIVLMLKVIRHICWTPTEKFSRHLFIDACGDAKMYESIPVPPENCVRLTAEQVSLAERWKARVQQITHD